MIDCRECRDRLNDAALVGPDFSLTDELQAHVNECADCQREANELLEAWLLVPAGLPQAPVGPELETALMQRVAESPTVELASLRTSPPRRVIVLRYALAASVLIALAAATAYIRRDADDGQRVSNDENVRQRIGDLARQLEKLEQLEHLFARPELRYTSLRSPDAATSVNGFLMLDNVAQQVHFLGSGFPRRDGQTYMLWLLDADGGVVAWAELHVDAEQRGAALVDLSNDSSPIAEAMVTLESDPGASAPSGDVRARSPVNF